MFFIVSSLTSSEENCSAESSEFKIKAVLNVKLIRILPCKSFERQVDAGFMSYIVVLP